MTIADQTGFIKNAGEEQFVAWGRFHKPIMEAVDAGCELVIENTGLPSFQ